MLRVGCAGVLQGTKTPALSDKRQKMSTPVHHAHDGVESSMRLFYGVAESRGKRKYMQVLDGLITPACWHVMAWGGCSLHRQYTAVAADAGMYMWLLVTLSSDCQLRSCIVITLFDKSVLHSENAIPIHMLLEKSVHLLSAVYLDQLYLD